MGIKKLVTAVLDGVEVPVDTLGASLYYPEAYPENPTSYGNRGVDNYRAAIFVGDNGVDCRYSVPAAVIGGRFDDHGAEKIAILSRSEDFTGVMLVGGKYRISGAKFSFDTQSDGKHVSDFNGYGAVINAMKGSRLLIDHTVIESVGVAKPAVYCDEGSDVLIENSHFRVMGGTLYQDYKNSASDFMVAPPWVLGIGGSARAINIMGRKASVTLVDSTVTANGWGVLSTDMGEDLQLAVIDCNLILAGEQRDADARKDPFAKRYGTGYGSYIIANAQERFYGVNMKVGTYGSILSDGDAYYQSSCGKITVTSPSRGDVICTRQGHGRITRIDSDGFGFMAHGSGSFHVLDGTVVKSQFSTFLLKSAGVHVSVENCTLESGNHVVLEMIDDDDPLIGADMVEGAIVFHTEFHETAGWPSENGQLSSLLPPRPMGPGGIAPPEGDGGPGAPGGDMPPMPTENTFIAKDVVLNGNLYNGTGYYGMKATSLTVELRENSILNGTISATESRHIDENGEQNTHFTIHEYYYVGHTAHRTYFNGQNYVKVCLQPGSVWNVTEFGIITELQVMSGAELNGLVEKDGAVIEVEFGKCYTGVMTVRPTAQAI